MAQPSQQPPPIVRLASRVHVEYDGQGLLVDFWLTGPVSDEEARRGIRAMMLAPTLEVCRALLRGEPVPESTLDQEQLRRFPRLGSSS